MDNFEKRTYLRYVIALMPVIDFTRYNLDLLDDVEEIFNIKVKIPDDLRRKSKEHAEFKQRFLIQLKKKASASKNIKTPIEKKFDIISDIYNLSQNEKEMLIYFILTEKYQEFDNINDSIVHDKVLFYFRKFVLNIHSTNTINEIYNGLYSKGILQKGEYARRKELNPKISDIFFRPLINTEKKIKEALLGKNQKSDLKWEDFDHIKKERSLVSDIIQSATKNKTKGINILLYGDVGTGKTEFSKLITNRLKLDLYSVSSNVEKTEATRADRISDFFSKQSILEKFDNACILFDEAEDIFNRGIVSKAFINTLLEKNAIPVFWTTNNIENVDPAILRRMTFALRFEKHSDEIRLRIWKNILKKNKVKVEYNKLIELNKSYNISPALITNAVKTTKLIGGNSEDFQYFIENVAQVVDKKRNVKNRDNAPIQDYNDELTNADTDLKNLTNRIKESKKLNFSLCLYGEPGTGKSLYARYLANTLGLEVIFKRASDLISKWVGETEQNIARAFQEAKDKKALLIFDEADTFLRSRTMSDHSWETSQVNEMLTQMESHQYPFVCTTNLLDILDEASLRRFTFKIKFDFMTKAQVNKAVEYFFGFKNSTLDIKGLTAGDFATVKKKAEFLGIKDINELSKMLSDEVRVKKSNELKNVVGF